MQDNFDRSLKFVLAHEGGFVNHPKDPGGATMRGVTLETFRRHYGTDKTVNDLRDITPDQLGSTYRSGYWDRCKCDQLPSGVDYAVFDMAVNSGPERAAKLLQEVVGAVPDGNIGPVTLGKVGSKAPDDIVNNLCDRRLAILRSLRTFPTFGKGWTTRVGEVRSHALEMCAMAGGGR